VASAFQQPRSGRTGTFTATSKIGSLAELQREYAGAFAIRDRRLESFPLLIEETVSTVGQWVAGPSFNQGV